MGAFIETSCAECGVAFIIPRHRVDNKPKLCSRQCSGKWRKGRYRVDITGQRFNTLVVLKTDFPKCLCKCDCGNEVWVTKTKLTTNRQKSCGCLHSSAIRAFHRQNYLGQRFYRLTCIDNLEEGPLRKWECDCGNEVLAAPSSVSGGNTKSCGCLKIEQSSKLGARTSRKNTHSASLKRWAVTVNGESIQLRSGFEYIYACYLQKNGIEFRYEPKCFVLTPQHRYTPDFYLPGTDEWIEVKGLLSPRAAEKHALFIEAGYKLKVLYDRDLSLLLRKGLSVGAFYAEYRKGATPENFLA